MKRVIIFIFILLQAFSFSSCYHSNIWDKINQQKDDDAPGVTSAASQNNTQVLVIFSDEVDETSAENPANYSIPGLTVTGAVRDSFDFTRVFLTTDSQQSISYTLSVANVMDIYLNMIGSKNTAFFIGDAIPNVSDIFWVSPNEITITFSEIVNETSAKTLANYSIVDEGYNTFNIASINGTGTTYSIITSANQAGNMDYTVSVSNITDSNGNIINPFVTTIYDTIPPLIDTVVVASSTELTVFFTEEVDSISVQVLSNYIITGPTAVTISSAFPEVSDLKIVYLILGNPLSISGSYILSVNNITDLAGNTMSVPDEETFLWP